MAHPRHRSFGRRQAAHPPSPGRRLAPGPALALLLIAGTATGLAAASEGGAPPASTQESASAADRSERPPVRSAPQLSPVELFAAVERAWVAGDAGALASYCDSAVARISLKPGGSPASAPTLGGLAFLIDDPLHLVATRSFRVVRVVVDPKKPEARAWARWSGDWGGDKGLRDLEVALGARGRADGRWLLTEIHAND